jgi:uroporphyrin-3 C-methyltransferase
MPASVTKKRRSGRGVLGWALLLALVALGFAGLALWQTHAWRAQNMDLREEVAKRLQESDQAVGESRANAQRESESQNSIRDKVSALEGQIKALEGQISKSEGHANALEALYERFSRSQEDHIVAEVRQAVEFADQQLRYAGNIETALIALRGAQNRLEQNDHGQFAALRYAIGADIGKLNQQSTLNMPNTAKRIEDVLEKVTDLPLAYSDEIPSKESSNEPGKPGEEKAGEKDGNFVSRLAGEIWADLRSLVKVKRFDPGSEPVLLAPEQSAFLRENVKIRLLTARLAVFARDGQTYRTDLKQARDWIERYFNRNDEEVEATVKELRALEAVPVDVIRHELIESATEVLRFQTRNGNSSPASLPQPTGSASGQPARQAPAASPPPVQAPAASSPPAQP